MALPKGGNNDSNKKQSGLPTTPAPKKKAGGGLPSAPTSTPKPAPTPDPVKPDELEVDFEETSPDNYGNEENDVNTDDNAFEDIDFDEQEKLDLEEEEVDFEDEEPAPQKKKPASNDEDERKARREQRRKQQSNKKSSSKSSASDRSKKSSSKSNSKGKKKSNRHNYVDEKAGKLKPFGRKQKNSDGKTRKAAVSEFDERNNLRKKALLVQIGALGLLGIMAGCGVKNAVFPPPIPSEEQIFNIALQAQGDMGFPVERGEGFVKDFMQAYMNRTGDPVAEAMLAYFYGGDLDGDGGSSNAEERFGTMGDFNQTILYGPTIYESNQTSPNSANYVVGVAVAQSDSASFQQLVNDRPNVQWRFFSVNVFYDPNEDSMGIAPGGPTLLPPLNVAGESDVIETSAPLNTGETNDEAQESATNTIHGYFAAFADASPEETTNIDQYTGTSSLGEDQGNLVDGLGGEFELDGDPSEAITHEVYYYEPEEENYVTALVDVRWRETVETPEEEEALGDNGSSANGSDSVSATHEATYVLRLERTGETWSVVRMVPYWWEPEEWVMEEPPEE